MQQAQVERNLPKGTRTADRSAAGRLPVVQTKRLLLHSEILQEATKSNATGASATTGAMALGVMGPQYRHFSPLRMLSEGPSLPEGLGA